MGGRCYTDAKECTPAITHRCCEGECVVTPVLIGQWMSGRMNAVNVTLFLIQSNCLQATFKMVDEFVLLRIHIEDMHAFYMGEKSEIFMLMFLYIFWGGRGLIN